ncbi:hypothetical protein G6O67_005342 [Ophiocordyceps sinensis]|uniref:Uncharacterized protein n=1 Tax=Ophiocordyceps sinensis TaxID=72228 RepID=A0A8H4PRH6_9HYPO|nr:hypothetical protein G6O67_005342 [Ophiocordyceps sinensis]
MVVNAVLRPTSSRRIHLGAGSGLIKFSSVSTLVRNSTLREEQVGLCILHRDRSEGTVSEFSECHHIDHAATP